MQIRYYYANSLYSVGKFLNLPKVWEAVVRGDKNTGGEDNRILL